MEILAYRLNTGRYFVIIHGLNFTVLLRDTYDASSAIEAVRKALDVLEEKNAKT